MSAYVPMNDDEWAKLLGDDYPNGLYYGFYGQIEQTVLARIAEHGLVIVPKADAEPSFAETLVTPISLPKEAERVALIEGLDYALGHITHIPVSHDLLRDIRAYLQGGA